MKIFAIKLDTNPVSTDALALGKQHIGAFQWYIPSIGTPALMVLSPRDYTAATTWLEANGWYTLPHPMDVGTTVDPTHLPSLLKHAPTISATDNTVQVMNKIHATTKMGCFSPF